MIRNISTSLENITPSKAKLWLDATYERQRPLKMWRVDHLAKEMVKDTFLPTVTIHFCIFNGEPHLINGQHTLNAIIKSGVNLNGFNVVRTSVNSQEELNNMYSVYDIQSKRTRRDAIISQNLPQVHNLSVNQINKLCTAAIWIENDFLDDKNMTISSRNIISFQDQIYLAELWMPEFKNFLITIPPCSGAIRDRLIKGSVLCIALVTTRYKPQDAYHFWKQVAQNDGLKRGDPRKTLYEWLIKHGERKSKFELHPNCFPRGVVKAWNKYMQGRNIMDIEIHDKTEKISLVGIDDNDICRHINTLG